jgi:hypothetical protein
MPRFRLRAFLASIALCLLASGAFAQVDSIWTKTGGIMTCMVKEITPDLVRYVLPNEDIDQSIYKSDILKIRYRSGREQVYVPPRRAMRVLQGEKDYDSVLVTHLDYDLKKHYILVDSLQITLPSQADAPDKARARAFKVLQAETALFGYNILRIPAQSSSRTLYNPETRKETGHVTRFAGAVYTDTLAPAADIVARLGAKRTYTSYQVIMLPKGALTTRRDALVDTIDLSDVRIENQVVRLTTKIRGIEGTQYRILGYDKFAFFLACRNEKGSYIVKAFF